MKPHEFETDWIPTAEELERFDAALDRWFADECSDYHGAYENDATPDGF